MAIAYINSGTGGTEASASSVATGAASATTGNLIVVSIRANSLKDNFVSSISDTAGNTYQKAISILTATGDGLELWYAYNITGNAGNVVTASLDASYPYRYIISSQYSGIYADGDPLDATASGSVASGSSVTSGTFTTTEANSLVVASAQIAQLNTSWTAGSGYTRRTNSPQAVTSLEDKIVSSILTNDTASFSNSSSAESKSIVVATFIAPAANTSNFFLMF